jgi:hypothetical protein
MRVRFGRAIGFGLVGLLVVPLVVMFAVLGLAHLLDPSCGTPGDSGGCEMGAASIGFVSAIPAMVAGVVISVLLDWRAAKA